MGSLMREILRPQLRAPIQQALSLQTASIAPIRTILHDHSAKIEAANKRLDKLFNQFETVQGLLEEAHAFHGKMTVHEAWATHPGVQAVFAKHHLPHCDSCPVGADERLEEAAFGYSLNLEVLLQALNALC